METLRLKRLSEAAYILLRGGELESIDWLGPGRAAFVLKGKKEWIEEFWASDIRRHADFCAQLKGELEGTNPFREGKGNV